MNWIDFSKLKYKKILSQPKTYDESKKILTKYFKENKKYNIYSLCLYFDMSVERFKKYYLNSDDTAIKELMNTAMAFIAADAMTNEEEYKRSLRYIIAQVELGQPFETLEVAQVDNNAQIIILPQKEK